MLEMFEYGMDTWLFVIWATIQTFYGQLASHEGCLLCEIWWTCVLSNDSFSPYLVSFHLDLSEYEQGISKHQQGTSKR